MKLSIFLFLFFSYQYICGQTKSEIKSVLGRVIEMDSVYLDNEWSDNVSFFGFKYFHSIFHVKVLDNRGDTLILGKVYNVFEDLSNLNVQFGLKLDSVYNFYVSKFCPCNSDFPAFYNCLTNKKKVQLQPSRGAVISKPYTEIDRIITYFPLDPDLWNKILNQ